MAFDGLELLDGKPVDEDLDLSFCDVSTAHSNDNRDNRIMVIDDDPSVRTLTAEIIKWKRPDRFDVSTARDAKDAINQLIETRGRNHRLIVTDNSMPGMNGSELAKLLRGQTINGMTLDADIVANLREVPIVMFTADPDINEILDLVGNKILQEVIRKPFGIDRIEQMLRHHVDERVAEVMAAVA